MTNSRAKGCRGERQARDEVRKHFHAPRCIRSAQAAGAFSADLLHAGRNVHVEVKCVARIGAEKYMAQAERDAGEGELPLVVMRQNRGEWTVMFRIENSEAFSRMIAENRESESRAN